MAEMMMKTAEEVRELKVRWIRRPFWDIEDTEGFEQHRDELLKFRHASEILWCARSEGLRPMPAEIQARAQELGLAIAEVVRLDAAISVRPA